MKSTEVAPAIPGWTYAQLSDLFWHHHWRSLWSAGTVLLLTLAGICLFVADSDLWVIVTPAQVVMCSSAAWHRAKAHLLTQLRFPGRRVG